jgi:[ribosomal protein S18]-alanine N-acetyltransferase
MPTTPHIRWMIRRDMLEVLRIESESFDFPWSEEDFTRCLRRRAALGMIAEVGIRVAGFMVYESTANRIDLLNIAVDQDFRRCGVGQAMIRKLIAKQRPKIVTKVRERNVGGQVFFRAMGFRAVRIARNTYAETGEDAYWFLRWRRPEDAQETARAMFAHVLGER